MILFSKMLVELCFLFSAHRRIMLNILTKCHENIIDSSNVIKGTKSPHRKITRVDTVANLKFNKRPQTKRHPTFEM